MQHFWKKIEISSFIKDKIKSILRDSVASVAFCCFLRLTLLGLNL